MFYLFLYLSLLAIGLPYLLLIKDDVQTAVSLFAQIYTPLCVVQMVGHIVMNVNLGG